MRYTPFEMMDRMFEQMRRDMWNMRDDAWESWPAFEERSGHSHSAGFNMDLSDHDGEYVFTADLPGFEKEEIDLRIDDDMLVLSAEHSVSDDTSARSRSISERVTLSKPVVEDEITATYHNGVLEVHLPIIEDAPERGHSIDIE